MSDVRVPNHVDVTYCCGCETLLHIGVDFHNSSVGFFEHTFVAHEASAGHAFCQTCLRTPGPPTPKCPGR